MRPGSSVTALRLWSRRSACTIAVAALALGAGCALYEREPELPLYPGADRRPINPYGDPPSPPSVPIDSGESALALALREPELLRHVQSIDAKYSGRRRKSLAWTGRAAFLNQVPVVSEAEKETEKSPASDESASNTESVEERSERATQLARLIEADGGYWRVAIASNVRETRIYYECELTLSLQGKPLAAFDARDACGWKGKKEP